jgi:hypothetical protein
VETIEKNTFIFEYFIVLPLGKAQDIGERQKEILKCFLNKALI